MVKKLTTEFKLRCQNLYSGNKKTLLQLISYALIGVVTNLAGYAIYILTTHFFGHPKLTMSVLYLAGATLSFFSNRHFTFQHTERISTAGARYILVQVFGYLLNLSLLLIFVDWLGFAHQVVQAAAIFIVAVFLFVLSKFFVFSSRPS